MPCASLGQPCIRHDHIHEGTTLRYSFPTHDLLLMVAFPSFSLCSSSLASLPLCSLITSEKSQSYQTSNLFMTYRGTNQTASCLTSLESSSLSLSLSLSPSSLPSLLPSLPQSFFGCTCTASRSLKEYERTDMTAFGFRPCSCTAGQRDQRSRLASQ